MALFRDTEATFAQVERIAKTVTSLKGIDNDTISIAAPYAFSMKLMPAAIRALRAQHPVSAIQLKSGSYPEIVSHVLEGRADIGLARFPLDEKVFDWCPVVTATNFYVFYPGHRFSQKDIIRPEDLIGEPLADVEPQMHSQDERKCATLHGERAASGNSSRYHRPRGELRRRRTWHNQQQHICRQSTHILPRRVPSVRTQRFISLRRLLADRPTARARIAGGGRCYRRMRDSRLFRQSTA